MHIKHILCARVHIARASFHIVHTHTEHMQIFMLGVRIKCNVRSAGTISCICAADERISRIAVPSRPSVRADSAPTTARRYIMYVLRNCITINYLQTK